VLNGVHPGPLRRALLEDAAQRAASACIHELRQPEAEARLSANGYEKLFAMLMRFDDFLRGRSAAPGAAHVHEAPRPLQWVLKPVA
jgi:hypothetical protein